MKSKNLFTLLILFTIFNFQNVIASDCDADFEIASQELTVDGWAVTFANLCEADVGVGSVIWDFGDGTSSTEFAPTHIYSVAGEYDICVVMLSWDAACVDERCDSWFIGEADEDCESDWNWEDSGLTVSFTDDSDDGGSTIITYFWNFGDGNTSDEINPEYTYTSAGEYEVCLSIITADGCYSTECDDVDVESGGSGGACSAFFEVNAITPLATGYNVEFTNMSTGGDASTPYVWSFGDGSEYFSGENAEHLYTIPGSYLVCVTMGNSGSDCFEQFCDEIILGSSNCIDTTLINNSIDCGTVIEPVCGCDNITYDNACIAENYFGVMFYVDGQCSTTSIEEEFINGLKVYPNPANNVIAIHTNTLENYNVSLRNMLGSIVFQIKNVHFQETYNLDVQQIPAGTYLLTIENKGTIENRTVIIQH
ncbi:MAG TPA: PKD domain-containing protein [Chitinophagales bacterium]|nr:PKD domain-containing protein [Chitinophagales bacterium]